ncbi:MAG: lipid-transfer protein [Acidimicrobiia bacterium]|nr:lipid-transfer protein [Acidimicrobiia bacterium]MDH5237566.1 lipid-transfer protein [Acidimicrobiia bacterium]
MIDVAIVASAQRQAAALSEITEPELMVDLIDATRQEAGVTQDEIGFTCSGSSDFLAGQAFSFVMTLDAVGAVPPIAESHVEMDGAWALYEAWVKLQMGEIETALVYSYGKSSPGSLRDVLATQLDPYYVAPLWPDAFALGALQARLMLESGTITEQRMAEIAARSHNNAVSNDHAVRRGAVSVDDMLAAPVVADPLRSSDLPAGADGGVAVILAAGDRARSLADRPVWIRGIDHRIDAHNLSARDLTTAPSVALAGAGAGVASDKVDLAELHGPFTHQEHLIETGLGLGGDTAINPSGGALAGHTMMAAGLMRIAEAARRVARGDGDRAVAHATSGPLLQQNLVCVLEGE